MSVSLRSECGCYVEFEAPLDPLIVWNVCLQLYCLRADLTQQEVQHKHAMVLLVPLGGGGYCVKAVAHSAISACYQLLKCSG